MVRVILGCGFKLSPCMCVGANEWDVCVCVGKEGVCECVGGVRWTCRWEEIIAGSL